VIIRGFQDFADYKDKNVRRRGAAARREKATFSPHDGSPVQRAGSVFNP
jgi:hypothetical protein